MPPQPSPFQTLRQVPARRRRLRVFAVKYGSNSVCAVQGIINIAHGNDMRVCQKRNVVRGIKNCKCTSMRRLQRFAVQPDLTQRLFHPFVLV